VACQTLVVYRSTGRFLYAADALRSDIETFYALESNLSESPRELRAILLLPPRATS
jgi:hypothetical protein